MVSALAIENVERIFSSVGKNGLDDGTVLSLAEQVASIASSGNGEEATSSLICTLNDVMGNAFLSR